VIKVFDGNFLGDLIGKAKGSSRQRQHRNIHVTYDDQVQRLFNAIEPGSYIRPHRHSLDPRDELLIAVRGVMALVTFDENGGISEVFHLGTEKYGDGNAVGAEVPSTTWHTVVALESGCVLLEVKAGPFDHGRPKEFAPWAPEDGTPDAAVYFAELAAKVTSP
jgi:cupin fold WbuC family metalloprotein